MRYLLCLIFIASIPSVHAQRIEDERERRRRDRFNISVGTQVEIPTGEYAYLYSGNPIGFGGSILSRTRVPFFYSGVNFTYARTGREKQNILLDSYDEEGFYTSTDYGESIVNHNIYRVNGALRFEPLRRDFQPYIEGLAGFKVYNSTEKFVLDENSDRQVLERNTLESSLTGNLSWAVGLKFRAGNGLFIEGRYEQSRGGNASFIDPNSFNFSEQGNHSYEIINSRTSSNLIHLGVSLEF